MRYVMKIGPVDVGTGSANAYVAYGGSGVDLAMESSDDKGVAALRRRSGGEALVCEHGLAGIAKKLGLRIDTPSPEALAMKAALAVMLDHGAGMERVANPPLILELVMAAIEFDAVAPWNAFEADEPVEIRFEPSGRTAEGCVMGQGGEEFGLVLYRDKGSIARVLELSARGRPESARALACTTMLFADDDSIAVDAIRAMTGVAIAPTVIRLERGKLVALDEAEIAALVAALRAVTALAAGGTTATGEVRESQRRVRAHATRTRGHAEIISLPKLAFEDVGRNEPCPCGSGKKFKRCHLEMAKQGSTRAAVHDRDERIVNEVLELGRRRFGVEAIAHGADHVFGDRGLLMQLVAPILAYEWPIEGKTLAAHFVGERGERGERIPTDDRAWLALQLESRLSVWEVLHVEIGKGVDVVDLLTGARWFVHEKLGTKVLKPRDAILARVVADDPPVFCGLHESPLPPREADAVVTKFHEAGLTRGHWPATLLLIQLWDEAIRGIAAKAATPMTVTNTDGQAVATIEDSFTLAKGAFASVFAKLAGLDGTRIDEHDRKGASLTFTRAGNAMHPSWQNTIVGTARVTATRLTVTASSVERADALTGQVRSVVGALVTWRKRVRKELPEMLGGEHVVVDGQATESPSLVDVFRAWLDSPVKTLGHRSPRTAVSDGDGRPRVHLMLKEMENRQARNPIDGLDPVQLRRELGLDVFGEPIEHLELARAVGAGRKISETLLDFAKPMLDAHGGQVDEDRMRAVLRYATNVWNLCVSEQQQASADVVTTARAEIAAGRAPADMLVWFDRLVDRKRDSFAGDLRSVGHWSVRRSPGMLNVEMEARLPQPIIEKLTAAGIPTTT